MTEHLQIIIVTYNAMPWIQRCLDSCQGYPVVVVDNASSDDTTSFIENNYPKITLLQQTKNLGFGKANNIGISYALNNGADYVFLLNQDAYLGLGSIQTLVDIAETNIDFGVLSPMHFDGVGEKLDRNFLKYLERYHIHGTLLADYQKNTIKSIYPTKFVNAAAWLLSKEVLLTVGGFDPLFFHYGEDRNFCQRVLYHGFKIGIVPEAVIHHDRENRQKIKNELYSNSYYIEYERYAKIDLADINEEQFNVLLLEKLQKLQKLYFKNLLRLNFKGLRDSKLKYFIIKKLGQEVLISRELNVKKEANYLTT